MGRDECTGVPVMLGRVLTISMAAGAVGACLAGLSGAAPAVAASAPAPVAAVLPAELVPLEQKMTELTVTSERFTLKTATYGLHLPGGLAQLLDLDESVTGETTTSPDAAELSGGLFGPTATERVVGGVLYVDVPGLGSRDAGRPWIKFSSVGLKELLGSHAGLPAAGNGADGYGELVKEINGASAVTESGPAIIEGQAVTGFSATLRPSELTKASATEKKLSKSELKLERKLKIKPPKETGKLEVFIAADGVPVRTIVTIDVDKFVTTATVDVLAINFPLVVEAPPPGETVTLAELKRLEQDAAAKARKKHHKPKPE